MRQKATTIGFVWLIVVMQSGCSSSDESTVSAPNPPSATNRARPVDIVQLPTLKEGGTAYVRVKRLTYASEDKQYTTSGNGRAVLSFGDEVKLLKKLDGPPVKWLVSKGKEGVAVPGFLLTASKPEIDFLRQQQRIPTGMTLVYGGLSSAELARLKKAEEGSGTYSLTLSANVKVWGNKVDSFSGLGTVQGFSWGMNLFGYPKGASPFSIKGNAVKFEESTIPLFGTAVYGPPIFGNGGKAIELSSSCLYYCVSAGPPPIFEKIDLKQFEP
ncbi:MAG: hypothetical protein P4L46_08120 [Fimbriimonas sp.]|nr:hypothetical protein [Fimbriimonas sp.]